MKTKLFYLALIFYSLLFLNAFSQKPELVLQTGHSAIINTMQYSPDGKYFASGSDDGTIKIWETSTGLLLRTLYGHNGSISSIYFSPDGTKIVSAGKTKNKYLNPYVKEKSDDKTIILWDILSGDVLKKFEGHNKSVNSVVISGDGNYLISGSNDSTAIIWDLNSGELIRKFEGHGNIVNSVAVSTDGKYVYSCSNDSTVRIWDAKTGNTIKILNDSSEVSALALSHDGKYLSYGCEDGSVYLFDVSAMQKVQDVRIIGTEQKIENYQIFDFEKIPKPDINVKKYNEIVEDTIEYEDHYGRITSLIFSSNCKYLIYCVENKILYVSDISNKKIIWKSKNEYGILINNYTDEIGRYPVLVSVKDNCRIFTVPRKITAIALSPDCGKLITAHQNDFDTTASYEKIYKYPSLNHEQFIKEIRVEMNSIKEYSKEGEFSDDFRINEYSKFYMVSWDFLSRNYSKCFEGNTNSIQSAKILDKNDKIIIGQNKEYLKEFSCQYPAGIKQIGNSLVYNLIDKQKTKTDNSFYSTIIVNNVLKDTVICDKIYPQVRIKNNKSDCFWNISIADILANKKYKYKAHELLPSCISITKDRKYSITGGYDGKIYLWDLNYSKKESGGFNSSNTYSRNLFCDTNYAPFFDTTLDFININPPIFLDTNIIPINEEKKSLKNNKKESNKDNEIRINKANEENKEFAVLDAHRQAVNSILFFCNDKKAVSCSWDSTVIIWDIEKRKLSKKLSGHHGGVMDVAVSPDDRIIASCGNDSLIIIWDSSGNKIKELKGHTGTINSVEFSSDGKRLLSAGSDNEIIIWDVNNGKRIKTLSGHNAPVVSAEYYKNSETVISWSRDNTIKFWNAESGFEIAKLVIMDNENWAVLSPTGQFDASENGMERMHFVVKTSDALETIKFSQLKERYYEPGLLQKLLGYNSETIRNVRGLEDVKLFPDVEAIAPTSTDKYLRIILTDRGGGIGKVKILINGKEFTGDARDGSDFTPDEKTINLKVDISKSPYLIPGTNNTIEVFAYNSEGYLSSRNVKVEYKTEGNEKNEMPDFYGIIIGISNYDGDNLKLRYASKDAEDFYNALRIGAGRLFTDSKTHITTLSSSNSDEATLPTKKNILNAFESLKNIKQNDILVVYIAGHGVNLGSGTDNEDFYYLTKEARTGNLEDPEIRKMTSVSSKELTEMILKVPALKQILILDVCGSGKVVEKMIEKRDIPSSQVRAFERMKDRAGLNILTGCAADAVSYEASRFAQGLLTYSLLMGIKGASLRDDGMIDVRKLFEFSADKVPELAKDIGGIQQPRIFGGASYDIGQINSEDKLKILLSTAKPIILQSRFQDMQKFIDHLGFEKKVDEMLRDLSSTGRDATIVFIDAKEFPEAYTLIGQYEIKDLDMKVNLKLFKNEKEQENFIVSGKTNDIEKLVSKIKELLMKKIK